mmetsp:Transcript_48510/g.140526  ORF Transcript_48510/g.140526 Transcript_48510/m.140526 type:complete len:203 (-) Transcript_48510:694-1302(-)
MHGDREVFTASDERWQRILRSVVSNRRYGLHGRGLHMRIVVSVHSRSLYVALHVLAPHRILMQDAIGVALIAASSSRVSQAQLNASIIATCKCLARSISGNGVTATYGHCYYGSCCFRKPDTHWCHNLYVAPLLKCTHRALLSWRAHTALAPLVASNAIELSSMRHEGAMLKSNAHLLDTAGAPKFAPHTWLRQSWHCATVE